MSLFKIKELFIASKLSKRRKCRSKKRFKKKKKMRREGKVVINLQLLSLV